jgi:hypothetical protein
MQKSPRQLDRAELLIDLTKYTVMDELSIFIEYQCMPVYIKRPHSLYDVSYQSIRKWVI